MVLEGDNLTRFDNEKSMSKDTVIWYGNVMYGIVLYGIVSYCHGEQGVT